MSSVSGMSCVVCEKASAKVVVLAVGSTANRLRRAARVSVRDSKAVAYHTSQLSIQVKFVALSMSLQP